AIAWLRSSLGLWSGMIAPATLKRSSMPLIQLSFKRMKSPYRNSFRCSSNDSMKWMNPVYRRDYGNLHNFPETLKVVNDSEKSLVTAFQTETRDHQLDLSHVPRTLGYKLWDDGALALADRKGIISEV